MAKFVNALHAQYIINGIRQDATPAQLLSVVGDVPPADGDAGEISDETMERTDTPFRGATKQAGALLDAVAKAASHPAFPLFFAENATRGRMAAALADTLWLGGHFRLEDLLLDVEWAWSESPMGAMAAFYASAAAAADYADGLGIRLSGIRFREGERHELHCTVKGTLPGSARDEELREEDGIIHWTGRRRTASTWTDDPSSWLIYIPFDPGRPRLGGSVFADLYGSGGETAPDIDNPDYFADCYEVIRELAEDGILLSGTSVYAGGLAAALGRMCPDGGGLEADLHALCENGALPLQALYAEIPGVVIQITDDDFDYLDAELTLQDIAFYPVGHPGKAAAHGPRIRFRTTDESSVSGILQALLRSHSAEGED